MQYRPKWLQPATSHSSTAIVLGVFLSLYLAAVFWLSQVAWRDPTSIFFRADKAYEPQYSSVRLQQSEEFLANISHNGTLAHNNSLSQQPPEICIGIPTVARKGIQYLQTALASLLDGLTEEERSRMHLIVFIADLNPEAHPAYHEPWIYGLADRLLVHNLSSSEMEYVLSLEDQHKGVYDYRTLLEACIDTGAPYTAIIEDDVVAADGWFRRTMDGLEEAKAKTAEEKATWLYLRLFFTEEFLGWNGETAPERALCSLTIILLVGVMLLSIRTIWPAPKGLLSNTLILTTCCFCLPLSILLFFLSGKMTTMPLPAGVNKMNQYGCCSQGLVFNRNYATDLVEWLGWTESGLYFDMLVEKFADDYELERWALQPPVLQHIGAKSSSDGELKSRRAKQVWSFGFELYDAEELRRDHELLKEDLRS